MKSKKAVICGMILTAVFLAGTGAVKKDTANGSVMEKKQLKKNLKPMQYYVTQECGTEPPFKNEYWDEKRRGIYVDVVTGEPLFSSTNKFDSGTGWPSFTKPISEINIKARKDTSLAMSRNEVRSAKGDSHLGHVFDDGPAPEGKRFCINSAALRFIPEENLQKEGYGEYKYLFEKPGKKEKEKKYETAVFAAGCFWGVEAIYAGMKGVIETEAGYTGGSLKSPSYEAVSTGRTGHAEAVKVTYDPEVISYRELLDIFWRLHDPTTPNRQGPNAGTQYRSAIFYGDENQKQEAIKSREAFDASKVFKKKAVTEILPLSEFYGAEEYHQKYYKKYGGPACHTLREK